MTLVKRRTKRGWLTRAALEDGLREERAWDNGDHTAFTVVTLRWSWDSGKFIVKVGNVTGVTNEYYDTLTEARRAFREKSKR